MTPFRPETRLVIAHDVDMSIYSSLSTGGKAEMYAEPRSIIDIQDALEFAYRHSLPVTVIGAGTHILVSDSGIPGLVIRTAGMKGISIRGTLLSAAPGESLDNIINVAIEHNLIGLERLAGIPGTIAGAIAVNASANGCSIEEYFLYADCLQMDGRIIRHPFFHEYFQKQASVFGESEIIISIALSLTPSRASAEARVRKEEYVERMFIPPCRRFSGEIFRDPQEMSAAEAIRKAGLTGPNGTRAGFSEYQCNTIFTYPGCTSAEIHALITRAKREVKEKLGIELETSIAMLGQFTEAG